MASDMTSMQICETNYVWLQLGLGQQVLGDREDVLALLAAATLAIGILSRSVSRAVSYLPAVIAGLVIITFGFILVDFLAIAIEWRIAYGHRVALALGAGIAIGLDANGYVLENIDWADQVEAPTDAVHEESADDTDTHPTG